MYQYNISDLINEYPNKGELVWIGIRPEYKQPMESLQALQIDIEKGLLGDHYSGRNKKRQVTLIQWEHLAVIESFMGKSITADMLRRNLVIKGINLLSLKKQTFQIGTAVFEMTGLCHPCSRMEVILGAGGYNAMRNHGGVNAQIIQSGEIKIGDSLTVINSVVGF